MRKKGKIVFIICMTIYFFVAHIGALFVSADFVVDFAFKSQSKYLSVFDEFIDQEVVVDKIFSLDNLESENSFKEEKTWLQNVDGKSYLFIENGGFVHYGLKIMNNVPSNKWVIILHGYRASFKQPSLYAKRFYEKGYNILMPNLRGHADSGGNTITFGYHDKYDVVKWIDKIISIDENAEIALMGLSMGAATVMMTTGESLLQNVKVAVTDSGYTSLHDQIKHLCTDYLGFGEFPILKVVEWRIKKVLKFDAKNVSSVEQLKKSTIPTLFIHGTNDNFVPYYMLDIVFNSAVNLEEGVTKKKISFEGSDHIMSATEHTEDYFDEVFDWVQKFI